MPGPAVLPVCHCRCHEASITDRRAGLGVSYEDVLEAAVACPACQPYHSVALLSMRLANAPAPRVVMNGQWVDAEPPKRQPEAPADGVEGEGDGI